MEEVEKTKDLAKFLKEKLYEKTKISSFCQVFFLGDVPWCRSFFLLVRWGLACWFVDLCFFGFVCL